MAFKQLKLWFDEDLGNLLLQKFEQNGVSINTQSFIATINDNVNALELKDRVELIADALDDCLNGNYTDKTHSILSILGPENRNETGMFKEFYWVMPLAKFVEKYGLNDFATSMNAIEEITKRNTGEYAIRPYLEQHTSKTLKQMLKWSKNKNVHLRRLASEGARIRLPWAKKLSIFIENPTPIIKIIDNLKDDQSKFVQKSVANNLNDILKDNYDFGVEVINKWSESASKERRWIIKHALRNQLKSKNQWAINIIDSFYLKSNKI